MANYILLAEEGDIIGEKKLLSQWLRGSLEGNTWTMADGSQWEILIMGVGAYNVMASLRHLPRDARLLNIGYAGSANYAIGSGAMITEARLNHPCVKYPEPTYLLEAIPQEWLANDIEIIPSVCYSNTDFVLQSTYTDCAFDMELAFIAGMGFEHLSALKIISDNLSLHDYRQVAAGVAEA